MPRREEKELQELERGEIPLAAIIACVFCINLTWPGPSLAMAATLGDVQSSLSGTDPLQMKWKRARMDLAVWKTPSRKGMLEYLLCCQQS